MSSVRTAMAPPRGGGSGCGGSGGGGGKRGRGGDGDDGRDPRRPHRPRPSDKISESDFGPGGRLRQLILLMMQTANLGNNIMRGKMLTGGGNLKPLSERTAAVQVWVDSYLTAADGLVKEKYTEMAEGFVHILRAVRDAGLVNRLVAMLVVYFEEQLEE